MARLRYPRQREYPQPPPPSKNNTRITISMVVIVHLVFAHPVQCRLGTKAECADNKVEARASRKCYVQVLPSIRQEVLHCQTSVGRSRYEGNAASYSDWEVAGWHAVPPTSMVVRRPVPSPLRSFSTKAVCTHRLVFSVRDIDVRRVSRWAALFCVFQRCRSLIPI